MDSLQSLLALIALAAPLMAAAAITSVGRSRSGTLSRRLAIFGAGLSLIALVAALVRMRAGGLDNELPLGLGSWLSVGAQDPLRIDYAIALDLPAAVLAAVISLSAVCALTWTHDDANDALDPLPDIAASVLLSCSLAMVMSTNVGELFVFWQIASVSAYLMLSSRDDTASQAAATKKFIIVQRVAELGLLCAVLAFAVGYQTFDYDGLFAALLEHGAMPHFALVHFIALCLLGTCAARCALIPFLGWPEGIVAGHALAAMLIEGICLMPAGALLLIRFQPVLQAAVAASAFAVLLGATSAFFAAVCAWSEEDARRQAGFACASVFGLIVMGISLGMPSSNGWAVVLTAAFVPTSAAVLGWFATRPRATNPGDVRMIAVAAAIVVLFSGICGQGVILGAGLGALAKGGPLGRAPLALALVFAALAEFFAAIAMTRAILGDRSAFALSPRSPSAANETDRFQTSVSHAGERSPWPFIVLAVCGAAVGLSGGALMLIPRTNSETSFSPIALAGGSAFATLIGCLPAIAGFVIGWQAPRPVPVADVDPDSEGLLMRLGRNRFYCDALLFALVALPVRAVAQFARFVDWFLVDGFVTGAPASAAEAAGLMLEPVQGRSVGFYLASAAVGTALLAAVVIWLR